MPTALQEDEEGEEEEEEGQSGESSSPHPHAAQILEIVLEHVLHFLPSARDRAACSLVSRSWHRADSLTRAHVSVGNCYAVSPARVAQRFPRARSLLLKGRPRFADFGLMPPGWGAHLRPWLHAPFPLLRRLHLKRLSLSDHHLALLPAALPALRDLHLLCCEGFGTSGLAAFAAACTALRELDLVDTDVEDDEVDWIAAFSSASIESLVFDCVVADLNFDALEALVARCRGLRRLRVGHQVDAAQLCRLLARAPPGLTDLGTGSFHSPDGADRSAQLASCFAALRSLRCLSGFRNAAPELLPSVYGACHRLTFLNLSYAAVDSAQFRPIISQCHRLLCLWVLDSIGDEGLLAVADTCKDLEELRVFPTEAQEDTESLVSDVGLVAISSGCRNLRSILYFCQCMTNKAVITMSENCRALRVFRLCIMGRHRPDHRTGEPMDEGFGAIVRNCQGLTRLAVSGLLTDRAFAYIGKYGKILRTLSVAFAGDGDQGLKYVLEGCPKLQKLEIRDSPFGDLGLLSGIHHYYNMRFLWMSACKLTLRGCSEVARRLPNLVVEVIRDPESGYAKNAEDEDEESHRHVETLYMYRSLAGPRTDVPQFVKIL